MTSGDLLDTIETEYGTACITHFGVGLAFGGKFTTQSILRVLAQAYRTVPEEERCDPFWFDDYNKYQWILWSRMTERYANSIRHRMHLSTRHDTSLVDDERYLDLGPYRDCWSSYLSTSDRLATLHATFRDVRDLRYLEIGCGTGHQLLPLAAYDVDVYGMELNPRMWRERHSLLSERITYGDALIDPWQCYAKESFDCIVVSMLGFIDFCDMQDFFSGVNRILSPTGALILDAFRKPGTRNVLSPTTYKNPLAASGFKPVAVMSAPHQQLICKKES